MKILTGIYRIKNLKNGKRYIGQSKNIYQRWKQHTSALTLESDETVLRRAFAKYGLFRQVSKEGRFGNFLFEIIEECLPDLLLDREYFYIKREKPEYNLMLLPPNRLLNLKSQNKQHFGEYYLQYHNYDNEKHFPGDIEKYLNEPVANLSHYISTRKALAANLDGANVILVFGISINKKKKYYIWTRTSVDELNFIEDEFLSYNIIGFQEYIKPVCLNSIPGFTQFQKKLGNFAYGLSSINHFNFTKKIVEICESHKVDDGMLSRDFLELYHKAFQIHVV
ncbi:MAG: GIY-YIG nuclease family protein [Spirochaetales bacterium]|nr:GIY-YIG nuclease family protein [Spirochaetales bacterium]